MVFFTEFLFGYIFVVFCMDIIGHFVCFVFRVTEQGTTIRGQYYVISIGRTNKNHKHQLSYFPTILYKSTKKLYK